MPQSQFSQALFVYFLRCIVLLIIGDPQILAVSVLNGPFADILMEDTLILKIIYYY